MRLKLIAVIFALCISCVAQTGINGSNSGIKGSNSGMSAPSNPLVSISVTPATISILQTQSTTFIATGTFQDLSTQDLTLASTWTSSNTSVATVGSAADPQPLNCLGSGGGGTVTVTATDGAITGTATLICAAAPLIQTTSLPGATIGVAYNSGNIAATGGALPYTWSIASGALPTGFTLNNTSPSATITASSAFGAGVGTYAFTLRVHENGGATSTQPLFITISAPNTQLPAMPSNFVNGRFAFETSPGNPITYTAIAKTDGASTWSCHGSTKGPYAATLAGANAALVDIFACRTAHPADAGYELQVPVGTTASQAFSTSSYLQFLQNNGDSSSAPVRITSTNPYPIIDPISGDPRDQIPGTYNLAQTSPCVRASNIVTCTFMNPAPVAPVVGELVTIGFMHDTSFQGQYTICGVASGCPAPSTTQFSYLQTGPNATSVGCSNGDFHCFSGMVYSLQQQNAIQSIAISGCLNNGDCSVVLHFASAPSFAVGNRFDIVNSVASGNFTADVNALNTTWYVASVGSDSNCATCAVGFNTYAELLGNTTTWSTQGTALHFNHIPQDQINAYMFTLETTGGASWLIGCAQDNCHHTEIDSVELRIAAGAAQVPEVVAFTPIDYTQHTTLRVDGCNLNGSGLANPNQTNCDVPAQLAINNAIIHAGTFAAPCRFPNNSNTACSGTRGIELNCFACAAVTTRISEIHVNGAESHGISGSSPLLFKVAHNFVEGSSEDFFFSYLPRTTGLAKGYFCNAEIRGNILSDDWFDVMNSGSIDPATGKRNYQYLHKNKGEFKNACQAAVIGNIFERSSGGSGEQQGVLTGNNSTPNNGTSTQALLGSQSHNVGWFYNLYRHGMGIGYYPSRSNNGDSINFPTHHYAWYGDLGYDLRNATLYAHNCYVGTKWDTSCFNTIFQIANRGQFYSVTSATASGGVATLVLGFPFQYVNGVATNTNCVTPAGNTAQPCGSGLAAGDWIAVANCLDKNYNTVIGSIQTQVPVTTNDSTLTNSTVQYPVPSGAGASTTGCQVSNPYGNPRFTTVSHNTWVINANITNPAFGNTYIAGQYGVSANSTASGTNCAVCYEVMARDWWQQDNVNSLQLPSTQTKANFFYSANISKEGTPAEQVNFDINSLVWNFDLVAGIGSIPGFSPSLYTEYNSPAGVAGTNNGASPPVTNFMNVTNACAGAPTSGCVGFVGNYQSTNFGVLGSNNPANVPDFAPGTQDYHIFAMQSGPSGSCFASGNACQAHDGADRGTPFAALDRHLREQQLQCGVDGIPSCAGTPYP